MKLSLALIATILGVSQAFNVAPVQTKTSTTQLQAGAIDRRELMSQVAAVGLAGIAVGGAPLEAFAEYVPQFSDVKQIYYLGKSLDKLIGKFENPDTIESGLEGVRLFNKDIGFYPGYAKNYVLKLVKKGGDSDVRTGYIRQACTLVGSTEVILAGGMTDDKAIADAVTRIKKAQVLIGKFLAESGVKDEKIDAYLATYK